MKDLTLEVKNYTKIIKGNTILDHVNLSFQSGHVYGFYGRNGSGKTMLFRAIATLIYPTEGEVFIDGKSLIKDDFDLRTIGILIEEPGFYPYLSGYENLMLLYRINHKKDSEHINHILDMVGLKDAGKKRYKEYSLGMKQRLRIAQAIMEDQDIIILDEPTNGLDEGGIKDIHKLIMDLKKKGKLVLLASHNKDDLNLLCDELYKIQSGKIEKLKKGEVL